MASQCNFFWEANIQFMLYTEQSYKVPCKNDDSNDDDNNNVDNNSNINK